MRPRPLLPAAPREPWLETVEIQESAAPYHDWNERITAECYAPNGASRIQNLQGQITRIVNNYSRMSFNFGATLLSWLEEYAPRTYRMILEADAASAERYSGHGSAMAQVYNHIILPLASERDARTQIRWGIADFEHRFGRKPEGMWLAETAVSRWVLDLMAQEGIKFTVLAPHQCARVRALDPSEIAAPRTNAQAAAEKQFKRRASGAVDATAEAAPKTAAKKNEIEWLETNDQSVDTTRPYRVKLDEGRSIDVFFYHGPNSRAIAFEGLLNSGEIFAKRLLTAIDPNQPADRPQLSHVATDGESYGHHHRHGEMALSYALHWIEENKLAIPTNYGEFLAKFPPHMEAEVVDESSWSCAHGVERWRSDCGCNGGKPWHQRWRAPLREALDLLRDQTAPLAEKLAKTLFKDVWAARDAYIEVVLDRSQASTERFFSEHATHELSAEERVTAYELMELERHTQLMYTSCGWFFDDISGIETVQIIAYAGRVIQLAEQLFGAAGKSLEAEFCAVLSKAESNVAEIGNGEEVYKRYVVGGRLDLEHVGAHYAISSMFRAYPDAGDLFCFDVYRRSFDVLASGRGRFAFGRATIKSRITEESEDVCFAVLHLGDQNLSAAVRRYDSAKDDGLWDAFAEAASEAIARANLPELIRLTDRFFGGSMYSLTSLFADEQHNIMKSILDTTMDEVEGSLTRIYEEHATLLHFLTESNMPVPPALALTAGFAVNASLRRALDADRYDTAEVSRLVRRAMIDKLALDAPGLAYAADRRMKRAMMALEQAEPAGTLSVLNETVATAESLRSLPMDINLWQAQNIWNDMLRRESASEWSVEWREGFRKLGHALNLSVDDLVVEHGVATF
ncbi:DUF3536 domain-containing protein [Granulicella cerasi]|uniref:DUF3536 domain-containing protein n=1 Tax=Granulicella cerasi TaxID=741063 RepID=A0ABW1ZAJ9_9BACT